MKLTAAVIRPASRVRRWIALASAFVAVACVVLVVQHRIAGTALVSNRRGTARVMLEDVHRQELLRSARERPDCPSAPRSLRELDPRIDPWGRDVRVICDRGAIIVVSAGDDGLFGTADDLRSNDRRRE